MIFIYRFLFIPALLIASPYYIKRMLKRGGYGRGFQYRFGLGGALPPKKPGMKRIWLHAVSVGEIKAIEPLLKKLNNLQKPKVEIILTTTTSTAYAIAKDNYRDLTLQIRVFPIDFWLFSWRSWNRIDPDLAVLMEGDLWPEHIQQANNRKIPIVVINARLSDRSFKRYNRFRFLARFFLRKITSLNASSKQDFERFLALGREPKNTNFSGNLKFDVTPNPLLTAEQKAKLKKEVGFIESEKDKQPIILLGASTWPGEESFLLDVFYEAQKHGHHCKLLIIPRHAERRSDIESLCKHQEFRYQFRSQAKVAEFPMPIYIADTTGELQKFVQIADIVFVGKSLPPNTGGQTPIEAAASGKPIIYGPDMSNFRPICKSLEAKQAALRAQNKDEAKAMILDLIENQSGRDEMAQAVKHWHEDNQGATDWTVQRLKEFLEE